MEGLEPAALHFTFRDGGSRLLPLLLPIATACWKGVFLLALGKVVSLLLLTLLLFRRPPWRWRRLLVTVTFHRPSMIVRATS
tara:strand:+ start:319 stop:564 length:246 start_codon:yes stop_codon:yes gene_type:complete